MTNFDYFKQTLTERELADIFSERKFLYLEGRLHDAWSKWCGSISSTGTNVQKNGKIPNIWFWERTHNLETGKWEKTGRNKNISIQQFLFMPYKAEYWEREVEE